MPTLYSARVCPYAHRTLALLHHLGQGVKHREVDLANKSDRFLAVSPTGKVPLLVKDSLVLYESVVINDYLADVYDWREAYPGPPADKARHRLVMKQFDDLASSVFLATLTEPERFPDLAAAAQSELDLMEAVITDAAIPSMLAFHTAPMWIGWDLIRAETPMAELFDARPRLREWLERAAALPSIRATQADTGDLVAAYVDLIRSLRTQAA